MSELIHKEIEYDGRKYIILEWKEALGMFLIQEVGRLFKTLIPLELVEL